tara:strand:- start:1285 stop:1569 length:285 start_codon:yes stop_codon:yes gene_type:complete
MNHKSETMFKIRKKYKVTTVTIAAAETVEIAREGSDRRTGQPLGVFRARWFHVTEEDGKEKIKIVAQGFDPEKHVVDEATALYEFLVKESGLKE